MSNNPNKHNTPESPFDVLIIGGGATGLGCAVDAAARGYTTMLVERGDVACATSSRSTKLIHGGLRYLQQGNVSLVFEALHERGLLCQNAPHLITHRPFLVPNYKWWEGPFYGIGIRIYDLLAGKLGIEKSCSLSKEETLDTLTTLDTDGLRGATIYYDGQFDDARLALTLARTAQSRGAHVYTYTSCETLIKHDKAVTGIAWKDVLTGEEGVTYARCIINAAGIFSDEIVALDDPTTPERIHPSQGVHLVLPNAFLPGGTALLIPKTKDGRVIFVVPWQERLIVGTTDTSRDTPLQEPEATEEEIDFILEQAGAYLSIQPKREDILSIFTGLRPLVQENDGRATKKIARDHKIFTAKSGLVTIAGGKWTTYRKMGMDVIDTLIQQKRLPAVEPQTEHLHLFGYCDGIDPEEHMSRYGAERDIVEKICAEDPQYSLPIVDNFPYRMGEVVYACRYEMVRRLEDVLARRTRLLFLDAQAAVAAAPKVAAILEKELHKDTTWRESELSSFYTLARHYMPR